MAARILEVGSLTPMVSDAPPASRDARRRDWYAIHGGFESPAFKSHVDRVPLLTGRIDG